ncbi:MAG TPA: hypothetical protein VGD98_06675 [Ktedonobacteraceae bacterium]
MSRQLSDAPVKPDEQVKIAITGSLPILKSREPAVFWPWLGGLLLVGLVIVGIVTLSVWNWLNNVQIGSGVSQASSSVSTLQIGRSAIYADLNITWINAQYTTFFSDDPIHAGAATIRIGLSVNNPTSNTVVITYYDDVRLLVPGQQPFVPTNLNLSAAPQKGTTQTGWIDFPVPQKLDLNSLKLQLGNAAANELLVTVPAQDKFNATQHNMQTFHPPLTVTYYFKGWQLPGYDLVYHLNSVDVRDSYNGVETKAGQQFYALNWTVDNPNGATVNPGLGFDYIRLVFSGGNRPPMDNTLPVGFKANSSRVGGRVVFAGPSNLRSLTIVFLRQAIAGGDSYNVSW